MSESHQETGAFPGVDGTPKLPTEAKVWPVAKATISVAPTSLAENSALVARLVSIINAGYAYEAGLFWDKDKWDRTSPGEVSQLVRNGGFAVAWLEGSTQTEPDELVGCVYRKLADAKTGGISMLASDARCRGTGLGRDLLQYAENWAKRDGAEVMQLELLYPDGWESKGKDWLARWYARCGYKMVRVEAVEILLGHLAPLLIQPTVLRIYHKTL